MIHIIFYARCLMKKTVTTVILIIFVPVLPLLADIELSDANHSDADLTDINLTGDTIISPSLLPTSAPKKTNRLFVLGSIAFASAFLFAQDQNLKQEMNRLEQGSSFISRTGAIITHAGSTTFNIGVIGSLYLGGMIFKDKKALLTAELCTKSLLTAVVVFRGLKRVFRRKRPYMNEGADHWFSSQEGSSYRSFPSGHATTAWSVATVIAGMYKDRKAVPIACYSLASLVCLSRMTENKHWMSDVFVGTVIGYAIGKFVLENRNSRFMILPVIAPNRVEMNLTIALK